MCPCSHWNLSPLYSNNPSPPFLLLFYSIYSNENINFAALKPYLFLRQKKGYLIRTVRGWSHMANLRLVPRFQFLQRHLLVILILKKTDQATWKISFDNLNKNSLNSRKTEYNCLIESFWEHYSSIFWVKIKCGPIKPDQIEMEYVSHMWAQITCLDAALKF